MAISGITRIEALNRENYDTWKIHMEALLVKNDAWGYVSGVKVKPEVIPNDNASRATYEAWISNEKPDPTSSCRSPPSSNKSKDAKLPEMSGYVLKRSTSPKDLHVRLRC